MASAHATVLSFIIAEIFRMRGLTPKEAQLRSMQWKSDADKGDPDDPADPDFEQFVADVNENIDRMLDAAIGRYIRMYVGSKPEPDEIPF